MATAGGIRSTIFQRSRFLASEAKAPSAGD